MAEFNLFPDKEDEFNNLRAEFSKYMELYFNFFRTLSIRFKIKSFIRPADNAYMHLASRVLMWARKVITGE
jgi:hypothetical protein